MFLKTNTKRNKKNASNFMLHSTNSLLFENESSSIILAKKTKKTRTMSLRSCLSLQILFVNGGKKHVVPLVDGPPFFPLPIVNINA